MFSCSFLRARLHKHIAFASARTHSFSARAMFIRLIAQPCTSISDRCEGVLSIAAAALYKPAERKLAHVRTVAYFAAYFRRVVHNVTSFRFLISFTGKKVKYPRLTCPE